uniref:Uncharacterized protein n=1 Tax=Daphnia galeata TaxID=27404 RepID=A0A8J2S034_9CRUS|nr:unnamed protein product [Daphnia galeata]
MAIFRNVMLVVIFGAVSSVQQNGIANNNSQVKQQDLELSEAQYYQVPSRGGRYNVGYGPSSKVKISHGYGVPSKSYGVAHKGYGIRKGIPLFRWDSPHPHYKVKGAVHHVKHGYPVKIKHHHHGKNVVHVIKVNHHHVKPAYVKPAVSIPASTVSSAGYGSTSSSAVSNHQPSITHSSGYSVTTNNKGQASAYGLNKKPFTAFKPFNKGNGVAGSPPAVIKDPVAPVIGGEVLPIAEVVTPVINVPAAVEVLPVVPEVVAPVVVVPEVVPAKEESPLSAEIVAGAEPQSAEEEEEEVEPVSAEIAPPSESPEALPPVENVVVQPEADPLPVEEIAAEPVISETVPVDPVEIEVEIVEIATDVAIGAPVEEVESVTEIDQQQKDQVEDEKADGGANKGSEEEEEGNSEERS